MSFLLNSVFYSSEHVYPKTIHRALCVLKVGNGLEQLKKAQEDPVLVFLHNLAQAAGAQGTGRRTCFTWGMCCSEVVPAEVRVSEMMLSMSAELGFLVEYRECLWCQMGVSLGEELLPCCRSMETML